MPYRMMVVCTLCMLLIAFLLLGSLRGMESIDVDKLETVIMMTLIPLSVATIGMFGIIYKQIRKKAYDKNGRLASWYRRTVKLMGTEWIFKLLELTVPEKIVNGSQLSIANVSANKGIYDRVLFNSLVEKGVNIQMHLMDLEKIDKHVESVQSEYGTLKYYEKLDALEVVSNFERLEILPVDVLFDIKGCLWYAPKKNNGKNVLRAFKAYYDVLKPGGILVIDAMDIGTFEISTNKIIGSIIDCKYPGYAEKSTTQKLDKYFKAHPEDRAWINEHFELSYVEIENHKPQIKMAIFKKVNDTQV